MSNIIPKYYSSGSAAASGDHHKNQLPHLNYNPITAMRKHHHQQQQQQQQEMIIRDIPKGCLAIKVGQAGEEQQRFVVPVVYFNHPLFMQLLKEAEDEYGFDQIGTITIPCHVHEFRHVQGLIDREKLFGSGSFHHHHHLPYVSCFRA